MGIRVGTQEQQHEILTKGGQIQTKGLWTTEALVDKLKSHIIEVNEEGKQQKPYSLGSLFYDSKYLNRTVAVITNWSKIEQNRKHHEFVFSISDILTNDGRLAAELVDLSRTAPSTLAYVLHKVVEHLFDMVSSTWFYQSAAEEIKVRINQDGR